jgi:uncharacterized protein
MSDFEIQIERLTDRPEHFRFEVSEGWWAEREGVAEAEACVVEAPFRFDLVASRSREDVLIEGEVEGHVGLECSRCGKRYSHALADTYRLVLSPARGRAPADPEGEKGLARNGVCLGEDLEAGLYRGPVVRLDDFFGEVIALAMPIQPLCDEGCRGICPHCGMDRNASGEGLAGSAGCDCEDEKIESPFAVLAKLKVGPDRADESD